MGETPLVNCGPRSILLILKYKSAAILVFTVFLQTIIFHTIRLILCYSKPVRLTTSLFRWGKVLRLCCAGSTLAPESLVLRRTTLRHQRPSRDPWLLYWFDNLGFLLRETCCCTHVLSPDFGQIRRWAAREMGLEDYTWKISEAALYGEFGLVCPCIFL